MSPVKKTFAILILIAVAGSALLFGREIRWWYKLRQVASAPISPPSPAKVECPRCNLIFISLDTLRADRMGFLGSPSGLTPNLDRIAAKSLRFEQAFTNAFFTTPSHMTVFTSLYPTTHKVESSDVRMARVAPSQSPPTPLETRYKTLAELLEASNYNTIWSGPLNFKFLSFKEGFGRGFQRTHPPVFARGLQFPPDLPQELDQPRLANMLKPERRPAFVFLHSYVTHLPYVIRPEVKLDSEIPFKAADVLAGITAILRRGPDTLFQDAIEPGFEMSAAISACENPNEMTKCFDRYVSRDSFIHRLGQWQLRKARKIFREPDEEPDLAATELKNYSFAYDYGVAEVDRQMGVLWGQLEKSGLLQNSVVVIFSDHGEELFEHGEGNHSSFYEHTARIPLLIHAPGTENSETSQTLISLVDVMPTVLDILGLSIPNQAQGKSVFDQDRDGQYVFGSSLGITYVRDQNWKLIQAEQGKAELFHLKLDPQEKHNLIDLRLSEVRKKTEELERAIAEFRLRQAF